MSVKGATDVDKQQDVYKRNLNVDKRINVATIKIMKIRWNASGADADDIAAAWRNPAYTETMTIFITDWIISSSGFHWKIETHLIYAYNVKNDWKLSISPFIRG